MSLSDPRLRRAALLSSGAWAVHELRFTLAPVDGGVGPGHSYLHAALPLLTVLVALAATGFVVRLVAPRHEASARPLRREWLACTVILLISFVLQEGGEWALSAHGPIFAAGGWLGCHSPPSSAWPSHCCCAGRAQRSSPAHASSRALRAVVPPLSRAELMPAAARRPADPPLRHLAARPPPGPLVHQH